MQNIVFKTQPRGFAEGRGRRIHTVAGQEMEQLREQTRSDLMSAEQKLMAAWEDVSARDARIAELEKQLEEEKAQTDFLTDSINKLGEQIEQQKKQTEESTLTADYQERELVKLQARNDELCEKLNKVEDASKQIGDTIIDAHRIAAEIVENANDRARTITVNAQMAVAKIAEEISRFHIELDALRESISTNTESMNTRLAAMTGAVEDTQRSFLDASAVLSEKPQTPIPPVSPSRPERQVRMRSAPEAPRSVAPAIPPDWRRWLLKQWRRLYRRRGGNR